jgi:hypothetical protein
MAMNWPNAGSLKLVCNGLLIGDLLAQNWYARTESLKAQKWA